MSSKENMGTNRMEKLHQRLLLIERAVIATRSELEFELLKEGSAQARPRIHFDSSIGRLLKSSKKISVADLAPYTNFSDDVYIAYDNPEENKVSVETIVAEHYDLDGRLDCSSCIKVSPKISFDQPPAWITIEDRVDLRLTRANSQLYGQFMLMFRTDEDEHIPNFTFWFRFFKKDGTFTDMPKRSYPSTSSPIMYHYLENFPDWQELSQMDIAQAKAMIGLPITMYNNYDVYLSHFALESRG